MSDTASIYIHLPFCQKKCAYCDFYSDTQLLLIPDYVQSLVREIDLRASGSCRSIDSLYLGGGTPSLLRAKDIETLIQAVGRQFCLSSDAEITLEVNPGTIRPGYLADVRTAGVNRLSIGVQSFVPEKLRFLGRMHTVDDSCQTIDSALWAGFSRFSLDLIYGVPEESDAAWQADLSAALAVKPPHLSCYMLTIEPGTPLDQNVKNGLVQPAAGDHLSRLFHRTARILTAEGYDHYEISSFSINAGHRSRHNSKYWDRSVYYGFGASAHSFDGHKRSWNVSDIRSYLHCLTQDRLPVEETETLDSDQMMLEMILLGLRTREGIDLSVFRSIAGREFESMFPDLVNHLCEAGFGRLTHERFFLTLEGKIRLDSIVETFARKIWSDAADVRL